MGPNGNGPDKSTDEWLKEFAASLRDDEVTAKHDRDKLRAEIEGIKREKLPSSPEVHVTVPVQFTQLPSRHSVPPSGSIEVHVPILGPIKAKGAYATVLLLVVVALGAWYVGRKSGPPVPPPVPAAVK